MVGLSCTASMIVSLFLLYHLRLLLYISNEGGRSKVTVLIQQRAMVRRASLFIGHIIRVVIVALLSTLIIRLIINSIIDTARSKSLVSLSLDILMIIRVIIWLKVIIILVKVITLDLRLKILLVEGFPSLLLFKFIESFYRTNRYQLI